MHGKLNEPTVSYRGGGLAKVTTMNARGDKEHHYSKDNIERECHNTPFLRKPLILDLGIIGTMSEQFD